MTAPETLPEWLTSRAETIPAWGWGLVLFAVLLTVVAVILQGWRATAPPLPNGWVVWRENREAAFLLFHQDGELWQDEEMTVYEGKVGRGDDLTPLADPDRFVLLEETREG